MKYYKFVVEQPLQYVFTGKFVAPSPEWIHKRFDLIDYELFVMTKGTLYIAYKGHPYQISKGEYLILPPSVPPDNKREGYRPSDCEFYWLHFKCSHPLIAVEEDGIEESKEQLFVIPEQGQIKNPEKITVLMKQLQDAARSNYDVATINYMTTIVLGEIYNQFRRKESGAERERKQVYYDLIDFVKDNLAKNLRVKEVAKKFGYNEKYLSHIFKEIAGISLKQYILKQKMEMANYMLSDTNQSIGEIAMALGYGDSHNFMTIYKKVTGLTPSEYRNAFAKRLLFHK